MIRLYTVLFALFVGVNHGQESETSPFIARQGQVVEKTEWPGKYSKVVAVAYDFTQEKEREVVVGGRLHAGVFATSSELSKVQVGALFAAMTGKHNPLKSAMCFEPHHGFVFYDDRGAIVGGISVCFGCRTYRLSPHGEVSRSWDWPSLKTLIENLDVPFADNYTKAYEKSKSRPAGTEQPATRPQSKSDGGDKPQPEADGRSR